MVSPVESASGLRAISELCLCPKIANLARADRIDLLHDLFGRGLPAKSIQACLAEDE